VGTHPTRIHNELIPRPSEDGFRSPWQQWYRRALGRKRASRIARSLRRLQRASPSPTAGIVRCPTTHQDRTHYALEKETPRSSSLCSQGAGAAIVARSGWGGLHHGTMGCIEEWADRFWRATSAPPTGDAARPNARNSAQEAVTAAPAVTGTQVLLRGPAPGLAYSPSSRSAPLSSVWKSVWRTPALLGPFSRRES